MDLATILSDNQAIMAPIIEWGGAILLTVIVLSPFLIIRHRNFKPTRWWHIVGVYLSSFLIYLVIWYLIGKIDQWLIQNYLNSVELYGGYSDAMLRWGLGLMLAYPLSVFYSSKLLYGTFTKKSFFVTFVVTVLFTIVMLSIVVYLVAYFIGQASYNF